MTCQNIHRLSFSSAAGITRYMSPNNAERADRGYSSAWLHHKGRNKHHLEYWIDYAVSKPGDDKTHTKMEA